jgi:hypothetical protein
MYEQPVPATVREHHHVPAVGREDVEGTEHELLAPLADGEEAVRGDRGLRFRQRHDYMEHLILLATQVKVVEPGLLHERLHAGDYGVGREIWPNASSVVSRVLFLG